jgi:hypothetical protein
MPRPRLPTVKAAVSGAALIHPERHKNRKAPKARPLGDPFVRMTEGQKEAWDQFRDELPWLHAGHRALLEVACNIRARLAGGAEVGINVLQTYSSVLSKLAATPVDETKVNHGDDGEEDPTDRFFGRPN